MQEFLRKASLTAKPSKCMFGFKELECLAHIVGNGEIRPVHQKVEAINKSPSPKTKKQIRSFIRMIGFYRKFIPHFAEILAILSDLTMKGKSNKVRWLPVHQKTFDSLKSYCQNTQNCRILTLPKNIFYKQMLLKKGLGAVLLQTDGTDKHPVMFISSKLQPREHR